jgi:type IV pilus assembly protein PilM
LAIRDEITSTEKLLDLIRDKKSPSLLTSQPAEVSPPPLSPKTSPMASLPFRKKSTIGVEIGYTDLKLVRVVQVSAKKYEMDDYRRVPLPRDAVLGSEALSEILQSALGEFCTRSEKIDIWSAISSAKVETRCIRIPKLPKKQIPNAVFWTFTKEIPFDNTKDVLDFDILGETIEEGIEKIQVMTYTAPRKEIETLKSMFGAIGYPLKGISIVPFAVQNIFRCGVIDTGSMDVCNLFVGRDWSRIAIYSKGNLILSRGIKAGMRSMIEAVGQAINNGQFLPAADLVARISAENSPLADNIPSTEQLAHNLFFSYLRNPEIFRQKVSSSEAFVGDTVFSIIQPAVERLLRQIERTFKHYQLHFSSEGLQRILLSGPLCGSRKVSVYIGSQLNLPIAVIDPFPADHPLTRQVNPPDSAVERESYVPAVGMALSDNGITPNFLFTHKDEQKIQEIDRINRLVFIVCMVLLTIMIGTYMWQGVKINAKENQLSQLQSRMSNYSPIADKNMVLTFFSHAQEINRQVKKLGHRFRPVGIVDEIALITPANIRLIGVVANLAQQDNKNATIEVDGIIFGDRTNFEASLTSYMLRLKQSALFDKPSIINKNFEFYENREVLRFTARLVAV